MTERCASARMYWGTDRPRVPAGSEARVPDANIADALREMAARRPAAPAVREPIGREGSGEVLYATWSFRELDADVDRLCHGLVRIGLERGMRTALMVPPSRDFFALAFALLRIGAIPVLVDPGIGRAHLRRALDEAAPEAFIGTAKAHAARLLLGWARRTVRIRVTVGRKGPWRGPTLAELRRRAAPGVPYPSPRTRADESAAILFTSGSTGAPKGAVYHHGIFAAQVALLGDLYRIEAGEVDLPTFPLFALFDVALGMSAVIPEMDFTRPGSTDPAPLFDAIDRFAVRNLFASPALLDALARHGERTGRRLPSLARVLSAGAPVSAATIARAAALLRAGVEVHTPYGATEALPVASIGSAELARTAERTRAGAGICVGPPVPGIEVAVIAPTDAPIAAWDPSLALPPGKVGEICVRGSVVSRTYFARPAETAAAKIPAGPALWHRMGDLGYLDAEGRIWFQGRKAHRVHAPWGPIDTAPVEGIFDGHPQVARTALIGLGPRGEARPALCVELAPGATIARDTLFAELRELGARHRVTAEIDHFFLHPGFPVDIRHNAKIDRAALAAWAAGQLGGTRR